MGGPGSGRYPKGSTLATLAAADDLGDLSRLSRVELEPVLVQCLRVGDAAGAALIRAELAARTWQNVNPYA